jgi:PAS domain S-box-containing protein
MLWQYSALSVPLMVSALASAALGGFAWMHRRVAAARGFVLLMAACSWWSLSYALYRATTSYDLKLAFGLASMTGAMVVALAWAIFALQYTGQRRWLRPVPLALLAAPQVLTLLLALTNPWHHAFWARFELVERSGRVLVDIGPAWGFWLHVVYSWALMSLAVGLVAWRAYHSRSVYRLQGAAVVAAAAVPWIGNVLYVTGIWRFAANPMPLLFTLSGAVFFWAIFRLRLLDLVPVAREALVEEMADAILVVEEGGAVLDLNPAARALLGCGDDAEPSLGSLAGLVEGPLPEGPVSVRLDVATAGGVRRMDARVTPLRDRAGLTAGRLLVLRDLTDAERQEGALAMQRAYLEQLFHTAPQGIALLDHSDRVVDVNAAWQELFGYTPEEARGRPINELIVPDPLRSEGASTTSLVIGGRATSFHSLRRRRDGTLVDVHVTGSPVLVEGRQVGIWGIYQDISDRVAQERSRGEVLERERALRAEAEAATRRAAFLADVGTLLSAAFDSGTIYQELARLAVRELADYCLIDEVTPEGGTRRIAVAHADPEREGLLLRDAANPPDADPQERPVLRVVRSGEPLLLPEVTPEIVERWAYDETHRERFQANTPRSLLIVPLTARGRTLGAITLGLVRGDRRYGLPELEVAREVARRASLGIDNARLYREATEAVRARDSILGIVSHDLRSPITAILLQSDALLASAGDDETRDDLEQIVRAAEGMERMIRDLLDVATIEAGRLRVDPEPLPAASLLRAAHGMLLPLAEERGIALELDAAPLGDAEVLADRGRVLQVLSNLVGNALKFSPPDGVVEIGGEVVGAEVRFRVRDRGPGIPAAELPRVWDRFWQAEGPHRRLGAGLGLAIARGIVEAHRGRVWVESRPGVGSVFGFALPAARVVVPLPAWTDAAPAGG